MSELKQIAEIPIDQIHQRENARSEYRESDLAELMTSMKNIGLLQAIGVKAVNKNNFEIVFGNRRFIAAKKLGWQKIEAVMTEADKEEDFLLKNTTENMIRTGVPLSEQGRIFHRLTKIGLTCSEIGARTGIPTRTVEVALDLHRSVPIKYQDKIYTGSQIGIGGGKFGRAKKGQIPMATAKVIRNAVRDFELKKDDSEVLYKMASQDGVSSDTVASVARLIGQGFEVEEALKKALTTESVRISVVLQKDEIARIEKKHATSIRAFLYGILVSDGRIKIEKRGKDRS
jgi:ParB/RepB/Spo0J family partition protein